MDYRARRAALAAAAGTAAVVATAPVTPMARSGPVALASGYATLSRPRRLLAYFIDVYVASLVFTLIAMFFSGDSSASTSAYEAAVGPAILLVAIGLAIWNSSAGRSPGKLLVGGRIVRFSNPAKPAGFLRCFGRLVLAAVVPFSIWFVLGTQRRAAHDRLTDTMVVSTRHSSLDPAIAVRPNHEHHASVHEVAS